MADGTQLNLGAGGDLIFDKDNGDGTKTSAAVLVVSTGAPPYKKLVGTGGSDGQLPVAGAGVAGAPVGGVLSVQGVPSGTPVPVAGSVSVSSGTIAAVVTDSVDLDVHVQNFPTTQAVTTPTSSTPALSNIASNNSSVTILAANAARKGAMIFNDSTQVLYLSFGTGAASTSSYTVQIAPNGYYELPFSYTGALTGIWSVVNGNARVTELT